MARSFDIASFDPSDGILNEQLRRKLNNNFSRVCAMIGTESPTVVKGDLNDELRDWTARFVADYVDGRVDQIVGQAVGQALDEAYPVGCVIVTATSSDPRLSMGSWEQVGGGRYVRAAGDGVAVMEEGGSDEVEVLPENLPAEVARLSESEDGVEAYVPADGAKRPLAIEPRYVSLLFYRRVA